MIVPMKLYRICPHCPEDNNAIQVKQVSHSGIRPCNKHKYVGKEDELKAKEAKRKATFKKTMDAKKKVSRPTKKKPRQVSKEAISKAKEENRKHRADVESRKKIKVVQQLSDEDLISKFLSTNEPSVVIDDNEVMPHVICGIGLGSSTAMMYS